MSTGQAIQRALKASAQMATDPETTFQTFRDTQAGPNSRRNNLTRDSWQQVGESMRTAMRREPTQA